jgi:hypothetical protein
MSSIVLISLTRGDASFREVSEVHTPSASIDQRGITLGAVKLAREKQGFSIFDDS